MNDEKKAPPQDGGVKKKEKSTQMGKVGEAAGMSAYAFFSEFSDLIRFFIDRIKSKRAEKKQIVVAEPDENFNPDLVLIEKEDDELLNGNIKEC